VRRFALGWGEGPVLRAERGFIPAEKTPQPKPKCREGIISAEKGTQGE